MFTTHAGAAIIAFLAGAYAVGGELHPLAPTDTSSPRATFEGFLAACEELSDVLERRDHVDWDDPEFLPAAERVLDCLDLRELPPELRRGSGLEAAVFLKEALDRTELPPAEEVPGAEAMEIEPPHAWRVPGTRIVIARTDDELDETAYLFTPETIRRAATLYGATRRLAPRDGGRATTPGLRQRFVAATRSGTQQGADTASPRGTLSLFLNSMNEAYEITQSEEFVDRTDTKYHPLVKRVLDCLDTSELPEYSRDYHAWEAAICLKELLDRTPLPPIENVPGGESLGGEAGGEQLAGWQVPNSRLAIVRIPEGPRKGNYLFSAESVRIAKEVYPELKNRPYRGGGIATSPGLHDWWLQTPGTPAVAAVVSRLPEWFLVRFLGMFLWQWTAMLIAIPLGLVVMYFAFRIGRSGGARERDRSLVGYWLTLLFPVVAMLVPVAVKWLAMMPLTIRGDALYLIQFATDLVFLMALVVVIAGGCSRLAETFVVFVQTRQGGLDKQLIRIIGRLAGIVAGAIVFLEGGRHLGFPVTTLLASAGIGGLAIALAGQSMLKGFFGTLTLMLDKPFREGERIVVKGHDGFVEEIGLRSTRIRTFMTDHVVSIPNDQMADSEIENIGRRDHIQRMTSFRIPIDTPHGKVERAVAIIRDVLDDHEGLDPRYPPRVYFDEVNSDSFNILVVYWYQPVDLWRFHDFSERVNLEILRRFDGEGIQFSLPLRHSFWKHDEAQGPLDVRILEQDLSNGEPANRSSGKPDPVSARDDYGQTTGEQSP